MKSASSLGLLETLLLPLRGRSALPIAAVALAACGGPSLGSSSSGSTSSSGCGASSNNGGLNDEQKGPGNQPGGVHLEVGDIAVSPDGRFVVFNRDDELALGIVSSGLVATLPGPAALRLAFAETRPVIYLTGDDGSVRAIDIEQRITLWERGLGGSAGLLSVAHDDARLTVSRFAEVVVLDASSGVTVGVVSTPAEVIDLEVLPDGARAVAVSRHGWVGDTPSTPVTIVTLATAGSTQIDVPNCSDDLVVSADGATALLAPTFCGLDPISHIQLTAGNEQFVANLPGFGPVAMAPDGHNAVGFLSMSQLDESLFDDPTDIPVDAGVEYQLMVIDTLTMEYRFHPYGNSVPRYAITPDGRILLVDDLVSSSAKLFDVASGTMHTLDGPGINYETLVLSSDSTRAYVLSPSPDSGSAVGLFEVALDAFTVAAMDVGFAPLNLNIAPDDSRLFLRRDDAYLCILSLTTRQCERTILLAADTN